MWRSETSCAQAALLAALVALVAQIGCDRASATDAAVGSLTDSEDDATSTDVPRADTSLPEPDEDSGRDEIELDTEADPDPDREPDPDPDLVIDLDRDLESAPDSETGPEGRGSVIWWGVMGFEVALGELTVHFDPFFRFHRAADYVLCTNRFTDHCSRSTLDRIMDVSGEGGVRSVLTPENAVVSDRVRDVQRAMSPGDSFRRDGLYVRAFRGFETTESDLIYFLRHEDTGLTVVHGGTRTSPATRICARRFSRPGQTGSTSISARWGRSAWSASSSSCGSSNPAC